MRFDWEVKDRYYRVIRDFLFIIFVVFMKRKAGSRERKKKGRMRGREGKKDNRFYKRLIGWVLKGSF